MVKFSIYTIKFSHFFAEHVQYRFNYYKVGIFFIHAIYLDQSEHLELDAIIY